MSKFAPLYSFDLFENYPLFGNIRARMSAALGGESFTADFMSNNYRFIGKSTSVVCQLEGDFIHLVNTRTGFGVVTSSSTQGLDAHADEVFDCLRDFRIPTYADRYGRADDYLEPVAITQLGGIYLLNVSSPVYRTAFTSNTTGYEYTFWRHRENDLNSLVVSRHRIGESLAFTLADAGIRTLDIDAFLAEYRIQV